MKNILNDSKQKLEPNDIWYFKMLSFW